MSFLNKVTTMYLEGISNIFSITGNINDVLLVDGKEEKILSHIIRTFEKESHVVLYSPSRGMRFSNDDHKQEFLAYDDKLADQHSKIFGLDYADSKYNIVSGLHHIQQLLITYRKLRKRRSEIKNLVVIFEDSDIIFPAKPINQMGLDEKMILSLAREIFDTPEFISGNDMGLLLAKNFFSIDENIREIPTLENVSVELPNLEERRTYISHVASQKTEKFSDEFINKLAQGAAGISLTSLSSILKEKKSDIERNLRGEVSKIISKAMGGKVSVILPGYGFESVIGYSDVKETLKKLIRRTSLKNLKSIWKGVLLIGPTGVGKDFFHEAFLYEMSLPVLKIGNLKNKWYGETLKIIEELRRIVRSFDKVVLSKAEADTAFSNPEDDNNHQTDQELMGFLLDWMGDNKDRGRLFWVFNTSRPQKLPTDFQRRVEIKIPLFDLQGEEKWEFIQEMFKQQSIILKEEGKGDMLSATEGLSNDNIRAIVAEVVSEQELSDGEQFDTANILEIINNLNFSVVEEARTEQSAQAAKYSTYKNLLPK